MKKYKIALFGRLLDEEWNPMQNSLYEHIKPRIYMYRDWDELQAIYDCKTGCFHVLLHSGVGPNAP
jgi:hypothetical protein